VVAGPRDPDVELLVSGLRIEVLEFTQNHNRRLEPLKARIEEK